MEGAPKTEVMPVVDQVESTELYAELIAAAQPLYEVVMRTGESIKSMEEYRAFERAAEELSRILAQIPSSVRAAYNLPQGTIFAPEAAANDEVYQVAA